jgi:hypothetical protein
MSRHPTPPPPFSAWLGRSDVTPRGPWPVNPCGPSLPHPQHEIFSPAAESCSLHAEVTEFPRICRGVSKWHQPRHATIRPHTGATKSYLCTRLNHLTSFLEINHACIDCPLDPQRLARLNGTTDDCAGGFGYLDIGNTHSARAARMVESDHEVVMRSLRAAGHSCAALQLAP